MQARPQRIDRTKGKRIARARQERRIAARANNSRSATQSDARSCSTESEKEERKKRERKKGEQDRETGKRERETPLTTQTSGARERGASGERSPRKTEIFNTIITSLKALDESFSSRNHVRKFLRALPSKWRPKVTAIEESKDLSKLSLDELVGNLKVYEVVLEKDLEIAKNKKQKYKSLALKAKQVLSDDDTSSSDNNDEEYAMAVRDFKKFFRRRGKFVRQPYDDKKNFRKIKEEKREDRRCFKCGDPNHFISDCPKNSSGDQKAFVVGSWSDSGDDSKKEEICLMGHSNEVLSDNLYYSSSSLDNESRQNEYDKLGQISLRIINKNKRLKAKNESLKKTINELKTKLDILEKGKETSSNCDACDELRLEVNSLKLKLASFEYSSSSLQKMVEMQKPSKDKCGLGYTETIASSRNTKIKNLGDQLKKLSVEPACRCHSPTAPASSNEQHRLSDDSAEKKEDLETNVIKQNDSVLITKKSILGTPKGNKQPPILKLGQGHGKSKIQTPPKTTHKRPSSLYPKSDYRQVVWNYGTQHEQQFQPPMYNQWSPFPPFPYMGPNWMYNTTTHEIWRPMFEVGLCI
ncbi:zf-CCHC domain-containing protein [Tanacetum coccineum]